MTIKRLLRRVLKRCRLASRFADVICPEHVKSISIDKDWRARVIVLQKLVFLQEPEAGDLRDVCAVNPQTKLEAFSLQSPDSFEVCRRRAGPMILVDWRPRSRVTPYALYEHEYTWFAAGMHAQPALCAEFNCETRTGLFRFEMHTPQAFEAAVAFERPRWPPLKTERSVVKYALKQLAGAAERPSIVEDGQRIEWKIPGPKLGARYICVAFHQQGIIAWKERLRQTSIVGGMRRLFASS